ncbi:MAG TPA: NAD(+) diphosphatase [Stellaceae bacterium]|nr:NAD(+) diphosphatase [Stellaceae bacterium]
MRLPNYYAAPGFERAGLRRRDSDWIRGALGDATAQFVPVWRSQNLVLDLAGVEPRAIVLTPDHATVLLDEGDAETHLIEGRVVFLGIVEERPHFALDLSHVEAPLDMLATPALAASGIPAEGARFADLRQLAGRLHHSEGALLAFARAMVFWHQRHRFCGVCGSPTRSEEAGHMRRCTNPDCKTMHFPRTDPAVIMLVSDGERALLGRNKNFPPGMYSTLAGFVEPGEALEDAVAREVREETAIEVCNIAYHSSQPWPFPANIMLGFHAEAVTSEIAVDYGELEDAKWFERDWLLAHTDDNTFRLPRLDSIARRLVEDWLHRRAGPGAV